MVDIYRIRAEWTGGAVVGNGVSTFYVTSAPDDACVALTDFFSALPGLFPPSVTITVAAGGETLSSSTGELTGAWTTATQPQMVGEGTNFYAAGVGVRVRWLTNGITNGRRSVGSTFLLPMIATNYDTDGTVSSSVVTAVNGAATDLRTALGGSFVIWHRPTNGAGGAVSSVVGHQVPDKVSWLVSRRR